MMLNDEAIRVLNCIQKKCKVIIADCNEECDSRDLKAYRLGARVTAANILHICLALIKGEIRGDEF